MRLAALLAVLALFSTVPTVQAADPPCPVGHVRIDGVCRLRYSVASVPPAWHFEQPKAQQVAGVSVVINVLPPAAVPPPGYVKPPRSPQSFVANPVSLPVNYPANVPAARISPPASGSGGLLNERELIKPC